MNRTLRRFIVVLLAALALFGVLSASAYASLDDPPLTYPVLATTSTNPGAGADAWWREGWGDSLYPEFLLSPPSSWVETADGYLLGTIYQVDRTPAATEGASYLNTAAPWLYDRDTFPTGVENPGGTNTDTTLDMMGIFLNDPTLTPTESGTHSDLEGQWFYHYAFYASQPTGGIPPYTERYQDNSWEIPFGIDLTPPRAVTGLQVTTGAGGSIVTTWTAATRGRLTWDYGDQPGGYDDLSGIGYYQVLLDEKPYIPEGSTTPQQGRVYGSGTFVTTPTVTIENIPAGAHKLSVVPIDRATNAGPASSVWFYSDPDTPTISFTSPTTSILSTKSIFSVDASDAAGPPVVTIALDGSVLTTLTAPPYSYKPDLSNLGSGDHTLSATATDHLGRHVTISKTVSFSNTTISNGFMTDGPSEFAYVVPESSTSNPPDDPWHVYALSDPSWTMAWGNSLHPDFKLPGQSEVTSLAAESDGAVAGMLYTVSRTPGLIDAGAPDAYYRSLQPMSSPSDGWTTNLDGTLDMGGVVTYPPTGGWPALEPGAETSVEGTWYLEYKGFTNTGWAAPQTNIVRFGIDVTPPSAVAGLKASPTTDTSLAGAVTAGTRINVTWLTEDYDALSGVAYYQVLVDGKNAILDDGDDQGRVIDIPGRSEPAATIENLSAGKHTITVYAVDHAGNKGATTSATVYSDPDTPTIKITSPSSSLIGVKPSIAATASDQGGVKSVTFALDGTQIASFSSAPYSGTVDLSGFGAGTHTLSATVTDVYGRQVTTSKSVTLDKTPLKLSKFSRSASLFYPIKRDGYKDNLTVKFTANKACSAKLVVRNSAGKTVRTISKSAKASSNSVVWNGKWSDGKAHTGTFSLQVTATDTAGNSASTGRLKTTIRNYQVVRVSRSKVKIVAR